MTSAGRGRSVYVGIAGRRSARVSIQAQRAQRGLPKAVSVVDGLYAVVLHRGTGPVTLRETTAAGTVVRAVPIRQ
jgi:hypothetical protein